MTSDPNGWTDEARDAVSTVLWEAAEDAAWASDAVLNVLAPFLAARVEQARLKALEEAAEIADSLDRERVWSLAATAREAATTIRALKDKQIKPWLSTDAQAEFKALPEINGPMTYVPMTDD